MQIHSISNEEDGHRVFDICGETIRNQGIVAFPTETVYGLGANGLDAVAVNKLFDIKQRPANDPVILHVLDSQSALQLTQLHPDEIRIFNVLCLAFWPGPLSIVSRAAPHIPREVTASTDFVAIRSPSNLVARRLIEAAQRPIAAPSANPFSRISPTKAEHVEKYFSHVTGIHLISSDNVCQVGIESTVVKIYQQNPENDTVSVQILRQGWITMAQVEEILAPYDVNILQPLAKKLEINDTDSPIDETTIFEGPGMVVKHYSPKLPCFLTKLGPSKNYPYIDLSHIATSAVLDLTDAGISKLEAKLFERSCLGSNPLSLTQNVFSILHEIETKATKAGCERIILVLDNQVFEDHRFSGVLDRLWRAAAGKVRVIPYT